MILLQKNAPMMPCTGTLELGIPGLNKIALTPFTILEDEVDSAADSTRRLFGTKKYKGLDDKHCEMLNEKEEQIESSQAEISVIYLWDGEVLFQRTLMRFVKKYLKNVCRVILEC
jgi:hypothetical protein